MTDARRKGKAMAEQVEVRFGRNQSKYYQRVVMFAEGFDGYALQAIDTETLHVVRVAVGPDNHEQVQELLHSVRNWTGVQVQLGGNEMTPADCLRRIRTQLAPPPPPKAEKPPKETREVRIEKVKSERAMRQDARDAAKRQSGAAAHQVAIGDVEFAVVDVETTGVYRSDRVLEVAVVVLNSRGDLLDEYVTLVNPIRRVRATEIHGITQEMVDAAPPFLEVADDLLARFTGRVLVAHNASFDLPMLDEEFARAGVFLPELSSVCTLQLSKKVENGAPRRLGDLCDYYGISLGNAHSALDDTRACARLFLELLARARAAGATTLADLGAHVGPAPEKCWPRLALEETVFTRVQALKLVRTEQAQPTGHGSSKNSGCGGRAAAAIVLFVLALWTLVA